MVLAIFVLSAELIAQKTKVKGYYRKDGTYVRPHYRSAKSSSSKSISSSNYSLNEIDIDEIPISSLTASSGVSSTIKKKDRLAGKIEIRPSSLVNNSTSDNVIYISVLRYEDEVIDVSAIPRKYNGEYELREAFHKFSKEKISSDDALELVSEFGWKLEGDILSKRFYSFTREKSPEYLTKTLEALRLE